jgi:hypothetical protein
MCYEAEIFKLWAKRKAQKREQIEPRTERARSNVQPAGPAPERETTRRREVEREYEEIV